MNPLLLDKSSARGVWSYMPRVPLLLSKYTYRSHYASESHHCFSITRVCKLFNGTSAVIMNKTADIFFNDVIVIFLNFRSS
jgi:hypothetical protein